MSSSSREWPKSQFPSDFNIRFPAVGDRLDQDEEWFEFDLHGCPEQLRLHDYAAIYSVPGLYEALVYEKLGCTSPRQLAALFAESLRHQHTDPGALRVLDLGAGNGIVAKEMQEIGVRHFVGLDLLPEARLATERDRPSLYADYLVADLCRLDVDEDALLQDHRLNCLVTVAALGFGDIPPLAFAIAFNAISQRGFLGMTIKEDFLSQDDGNGFAGLLKMLTDERIIDIQARQRYCHRLSISGEKLFYVAIVASKRRHIPASALELLARSSTSGNTQESAGRADGQLFGT